jgi:hypothetical protein
LQAFGDVMILRPGESYWLNEEQVLFIISRAETPTAYAVKLEMMRAGVEWKRAETRAAIARAECLEDARIAVEKKYDEEEAEQKRLRRLELAERQRRWPVRN